MGILDIILPWRRRDKRIEVEVRAAGGFPKPEIRALPFPRGIEEAERIRDRYFAGEINLDEARRSFIGLGRRGLLPLDDVRGYIDAVGTFKRTGAPPEEMKPIPMYASVEEMRREAERIKYLQRIGKITAAEARREIEALRGGRERYTEAAGRAASYGARKIGLFSKWGEGAGWEAKGMARMDPKIRSAINKGRVWLRKEAKKIFDEKLGAITTRINDVKNNFTKAKELHEKTREKAENFLKDKGGTGILDMAAAVPQAKAVSMIAGAVEKLTSGGENKGEALLVEELRQSYENLLSAEKELKELEKQSETDVAVNMMKGYLKARADEIATELGLQGDYRNYLIDEADMLAYFYGKQYSNFLGRQLGRLGILTRGVAMGTLTWGDVWGLFWDNIKTLIFGPWLWGMGLAALQWFFVAAYIQPIAPSPYYFVLPIVTGFFVFIMNIEASKYPWDWLTHFVAGVIIGFSTTIFLIAIWTPQDLAEFTGIGSWLFFWFIWAFLALFVGVFQFYHSGGFITVFQLSIIIMLFGYVALGPYSGYYQMVLDQVKEPLKLAWRAVYNAFTDVWLLATNPTEWYARQQVVNVRPEKPMSYPKALEVTSLDAIPDAVPGGEEFSIVAIIKNEGKSKIENVRIGYDCGDEKRNYVNCDKVKDNIEPSIYKEGNSLEPGETDRITLSGFLTVPREGREAESRRAKIKMKFYYSYSTNASLLVEVVGKDEIKRRQYEEREVYHNVLAVDKGTTARLSLNVGPQPIHAMSKAKVLISVSNTRDDGNIILEKGKKIIIKMDGILGTLEECHGRYVGCNETGDNVIECTIEPVGDDKIVIKPYEFNSILPIFCDFTASDVEVSTGLIRAELPDYTFVVEKEKSVTLTPPLGIIPTTIPGEGEGGEGNKELEECEQLKKDIDNDKISCHMSEFPENLKSRICIKGEGLVGDTWSNCECDPDKDCIELCKYITTTFYCKYTP